MASPVRQLPSFIFFPPIVFDRFLRCIHLTDNTLLKQIKRKKNACVREQRVVSWWKRCFSWERRLRWTGQSLKSLPVWNASVFCYDNEGRSVEKCNSKTCMVALSLWGTVSPSEWSSGAHDWVMWPDGDTELGVTPFISQEPLAMWVGEGRPCGATGRAACTHTAADALQWVINFEHNLRIKQPMDSR